jgi:Carbohydrate esterase, sialic acid-specific acetylesterase
MKTKLLCAALSALTLGVHAAPIPLHLPRPDGKPADQAKPVKVYILAGQSNMVGMGDIAGARPPYPRIYLSADPAIIPGIMPVGTGRAKSACRWIWRGIPALEKHGVYQNATGNEVGASVAIHQGAYDSKADYTTLQAAKTETVALGTTAARIPTLEGPCTPVATAFIDVPVTGNYLVHVGFGDSAQAIASVNGTEVYRKESSAKPTLTKITLEAGKRHPLQIIYLKGGSAAFWLEQVDLVDKGDLVTLTNKDGKFPYLLDEKGKWSVRNDVYFQEARVVEEGKGSPLSAISNNGKSIGPEVGFGFVMGTHHVEQVLLIKTAMGNRSLGSDFRPPSSKPIDPTSQWEGLEYRLMLKGVRQTLANLDKVVPGYKGQGSEIVGFGWFQGHKDSGSTKEDYEKNLDNLINDLRKDLNAPNMKTVVANFPMNNYDPSAFIPAIGPLSVWVEEQKIPPVALADSKP